MELHRLLATPAGLRAESDVGVLRDAGMQSLRDAIDKAQPSGISALLLSLNGSRAVIGSSESGSDTISMEKSLTAVITRAAEMRVEAAMATQTKVVKKGKVTMKCWDIGGQQQYRSEWGRYTRGCDVIMFVVDAYNVDRIADARRELHRLLEDRCVVVTALRRAVSARCACARPCRSLTPSLLPLGSASIASSRRRRCSCLRTKST